MNTDKENIINNDSDTIIDDTKDSNNQDSNNPFIATPFVIPPCPYTSPDGYTVDKIEKLGDKDKYTGIYKGKKVWIDPVTWEPKFMNREKDCPAAVGSVFDSQNASERGKAGQIKSLETKQRKKFMKDTLLEVLDSTIKDKNGNDVNVRYAISLSLAKQAILGNVQAYITIRDTVGEKPTENIMVNSEPVETEKRLTAEEIARKYLDDADAQPKKAQKEPIETTFVPENP